MSYNNPDYPTNDGAFIMHTYQQSLPTEYMWNGIGVNPMPSTNVFMDSRRNIQNPTNPFAPQPQQFPQSFPQNASQISEANVMPFSSYPPATPFGNVPAGGLNQMIESRRNIPMQNTTNNNPWANTIPMPQQTMQQPQSPFPQTNPNPYDYGYGYANNTNFGNYNYYGNNSLYNGNISSFTKDPKWDNPYTKQNPINQPAIDWHTCYQQQAQPQYPTNAQYPVVGTIPESWKDIAERNWK